MDLNVTNNSPYDLCYVNLLSNQRYTLYTVSFIICIIFTILKVFMDILSIHYQRAHQKCLLTGFTTRIILNMTINKNQKNHGIINMPSLNSEIIKTKYF